MFAADPRRSLTPLPTPGDRVASGRVGGILLGALVGVALMLGGCGGEAAAPTTTTAPLPSPSTTSTTVASSNAPGAGEVVSVEGFPKAPFTIIDADGASWPLCLWLAATRQDRERGLMFVTDASLGGADGMVFDFDVPTLGGFWMRNTPLPLSIAFFDADGAFVQAADMAPCGDREDCPTHGPGGASYRYAVEVPQGGLPARGIGPGATLRPGGAACGVP